MRPPLVLLPAIDLRGGRCVRLLRGDFSRATRYSDDPVATARGFADAGARWLHIIDLDAAEGRGADNRGVLERVRRAVGCRIQAGGGVRDAATADRLLELGVDRVVIGTALVRRPADVASWIRGREERFAAGVDAADGVVRIAGWTEDAGANDLGVVGGLARLGVRWLVYTNINRDGTLAGPDVARTRRAARAAGVPTLLSGGVGSEADVDAVAGDTDPLVAGVILGRSVYESRVDLAALFRRHPQDQATRWDARASG